MSKTLRSENVRYADQNLQIVRSLAEAIQDAGGDPDQDLHFLLGDNADKEALGEIANKLMAKRLKKATDFGFDCKPVSIEKVLHGLKWGLASHEKEIAQLLPRLPREIDMNAFIYPLLQPVRAFNFPGVTSLFLKQGINVATPGELVASIPFLRNYILKHNPNSVVGVHSRTVSDYQGLLYRLEARSGNVFCERVYFLQDSYDLASTDYVLTRR